MIGQVVGAEDRSPVDELDDGDPGQAPGEHPEALEREPEQGEQRGLEDPVVPDQQGPRRIRSVGRRIAARLEPTGRRPVDRRRRAGPPPSRGPSEPGPRPRPPARRRVPELRAGGSATPRGPPSSGPRPRSSAGPPIRPGRAPARPGSARSGGAGDRSASARSAKAVGDGFGGLARPPERRVDDLDRRSGRDGDRGGAVRVGETTPGRGRLAQPEQGEGRLEATLEASLDDGLRFAVTEQDEAGVEAWRDRQRPVAQRGGSPAGSSRRP